MTMKAGTLKKRILTGDRPTGKLHLGHFAGSLLSRVRLQDDYETFILLADVQALTTHFEQPELIRNSILQVAVDNLSVGLDPDKVTFVQQSQIPAIAELTVLFSIFVPVNVLRHNPTIKTEAAHYGYEDLTYGFLGYPVSQTADIVFCQADLVPVGGDQLPHMELTRKIVRRFNDLYGASLKEPLEMLSDVPRLRGLDGGSKMGKSAGNAVLLSDTEQELAKKIGTAKTDESRIHKSDAGHPEVCTVFSYQAAFNTCRQKEICAACRQGTMGCRECKDILTQHLNSMLSPVREKRRFYENHADMVRELIADGSRKARTIGDETVLMVKDAMSLIL
jgi:tryptophanyl-tRNA synthetase